jgi:hypothetical protein
MGGARRRMAGAERDGLLSLEADVCGDLHNATALSCAEPIFGLRCGTKSRPRPAGFDRRKDDDEDAIHGI